MTIGDFFHGFYYLGKAIEGIDIKLIEPNVLFLYGAYCSYFKRDNEAIQAFNAFLQKTNDEVLSVEANLHLAFGHRSVGNNIQAVNIFRKLNGKKHPFLTENDIYFQYVSTFLMSGNFMFAKDNHWVLTHLNFDELNLEFAYRYTCNQDYENALVSINNISEGYKETRNLMLLKAFINYKTNALQPAFELLKSILKDNDLDGFTWGLLGMVFAKNYNLYEAIISLKNARILQPDIIEFSKNLAVAIDIVSNKGTNDISSDCKSFCCDSKLIPINWNIFKLSNDMNYPDVIHQHRNLYKSFQEIQIQKLLKSPAELQENRVRTSPIFLTKEFYSYLNDYNETNVISEKSKFASLFP